MLLLSVFWLSDSSRLLGEDDAIVLGLVSIYLIFRLYFPILLNRDDDCYIRVVVVWY